MTKLTYLSAFVVLMAIVHGEVSAQEVFKKKGYTLTFESNHVALDPALKQRMIKTFFTVYPKLAKEYNVNTLKEVKFLVDTAYKGVAAASAGKVVYSYARFKFGVDNAGAIWALPALKPEHHYKNSYRITAGRESGKN